MLGKPAGIERLWVLWVTTSAGMQKIGGPGSDHHDEVLRRGAYRQFRKLFLGNTSEEAALRTQPAPLGWWGLAEITRFKLAGGAIGIEIQDPFAWQRAIARQYLRISLRVANTMLWN